MCRRRKDVAAIQKETENSVIATCRVVSRSSIQNLDAAELIVDHRDRVLAGEVVPDAGRGGLNVLEERVERWGDPVDQFLTANNTMVFKVAELFPTGRDHLVPRHGAHQMPDVVAIEFSAEANERRRIPGPWPKLARSRPNPRLLVGRSKFG